MRIRASENKLVKYSAKEVNLHVIKYQYQVPCLITCRIKDNTMVGQWKMVLGNKKASLEYNMDCLKHLI